MYIFAMYIICILQCLLAVFDTAMFAIEMFATYTVSYSTLNDDVDLNRLMLHSVLQTKACSRCDERSILVG